MAATRRELLMGLGAGLVAMQARGVAAGAGVKDRLASMGDIERLEREIRDVNQRLQNALAGSRRSGFSPGPILLVGNLNASTSALGTYSDGVTPVDLTMPFAGSVMAMSVHTDSVLSGTPGLDNYTIGISINGGQSGGEIVLDAGEDSTYDVFDKTVFPFSAGDSLLVAAVRTGSPGNREAAALIWLSRA